MQRHVQAPANYRRLRDWLTQLHSTPLKHGSVRNGGVVQLRCLLFSLTRSDWLPWCPVGTLLRSLIGWYSQKVDVYRNEVTNQTSNQIVYVIHTKLARAHVNRETRIFIHRQLIARVIYDYTTPLLILCTNPTSYSPLQLTVCFDYQPPQVIIS